MLKPYEELRKVDVLPFCEERDGFTYLNWAKCVDLLHENGAKKVFFEPVPDPRTGTSLRMTEKIFSDSKGNTNQCYETCIRVVIDDNEYIMQSPVMNGANPVKDNSMNQLRVWTSMCRSFVKCVAINTGLGFDLWLKEEMQPFSGVIPKAEKLADETQLKVIKNTCEKHGVNLEKWVSTNNTTVEKLTETQAAQMLRTLAEKYG